MNTRGNPQSLVPSHPGNLNAAKQGVHSPRLLQARAAEVASELTESFEFSPAERLAVHEASRCIAILEAIDRELDQRGLVDREGKPRYLLNHRSRTSRQLEQWLEKVSAAIERKAASEQAVFLGCSGGWSFLRGPSEHHFGFGASKRVIRRRNCCREACRP